MIYTLVDKFVMNDFSNLIIDNLKKENAENIIFDVGCFQGNFSRKLKKKIKNNNTHFFLFDPNPNLKIPDFEYNKLALSNNEEVQDYYLNNFFPSSGSSLKTIVKDDKLWNFSRKLLSLNLNKGFSSHKIKTGTLDNFCINNKINKIDVLKIDAEGAELEILLGGKNILKHTYMIQIEILGTKKNFTELYLKICSFLQENYNYRILSEKNIWSVKVFSNMRAKDVLFIKNTD